MLIPPPWLHYKPCQTDSVHVAAESRLIPARSLLDATAVRIGSCSGPMPGQGTGRTPARERSALTARLRATATLRLGETVEAQEGGARRRFPGHIIVDERAEALQTAREWGRRDTTWTDGSRLDSGGVGAVCVWKSLAGRSGRRYYLSTN